MVEDRRQRGVKVGLLELQSLWPFPKETLREKCEGRSHVLVVEMNMGQISREVKRVNSGSTEVFKYNRIDGQLITPVEIFEEIQKI